MFKAHWTNSAHHDGSSRYVDPSTQHRLGSTVTLRLRVDVHSPIERVFVRTNPDGEQHLDPMQLVGTDSVCNWWEAQIKLHMLHNNYRFLFLTSEGSWWLTAAGMVRHTPTDANDFKILAQYHAPAWVQDSVFYQIFPDRFADGDSTNNVFTNEYLCHGKPVIARQWGEIPQARGISVSAQLYGGDLLALVQTLDYLHHLGITTLLPTPILTSPSNHKYDTNDYRKVDPHFGGDEALVALRKALDERNMRLILDIVPNHCSSDHPWFLAAQADSSASTAEYFTFGKSRDEYESWLGVRSLPKLNYRSEHLRQEMYAGEDSIMRYWVRPHVRIDA